MTSVGAGLQFVRPRVWVRSAPGSSSFGHEPGFGRHQFVWPRVWVRSAPGFSSFGHGIGPRPESVRLVTALTSVGWPGSSSFGHRFGFARRRSEFVWSRAWLQPAPVHFIKVLASVGGVEFVRPRVWVRSAPGSSSFGHGSSLGRHRDPGSLSLPGTTGEYLWYSPEEWVSNDLAIAGCSANAMVPLNPHCDHPSHHASSDECRRPVLLPWAPLAISWRERCPCVDDTVQIDKERWLKSTAPLPLLIIVNYSEFVLGFRRLPIAPLLTKVPDREAEQRG